MQNAEASVGIHEVRHSNASLWFPNFTRQMKGIEYELILSKEPSLFVIRKQVRHSPETVTHTGTYYVLHGSIYASPVVHTVISEQLVGKTSLKGHSRNLIAPKFVLFKRRVFVIGWEG